MGQTDQLDVTPAQSDNVTHDAWHARIARSISRRVKHVLAAAARWRERQSGRSHAVDRDHVGRYIRALPMARYNDEAPR